MESFYQWAYGSKKLYTFVYNMRKFIITVVCLVLCLFIALNAVTQLLTISNTVVNIAGIVLLIVAIWIGVEVIIKFIKIIENEK